jgi:acetoin utilization deacetylase AcuC-like enzyme
MLATYIYHDIFKQHLMPEHHPECPARVDVIDNQLMASGIDGLLLQQQAKPATDEQLLQVHTKAHLQRLTQAQPEQGITFFDNDVYLSPQSLAAARYAAGAPILGVDLVMQAKTNVVFCNVRPPGHHAEKNRAMGFCLFNNIAVAASYALNHCGLNRIAILDFDVHHGNGTQDIFLDDERVLFCSSFQYPFYPGTPIDDMPAHILNVPLKAGCRSENFREAIQGWWPALAAHKPQLIFISAGFDAFIDDDMSSVQLVEQEYFWISQKIRVYMDESKNNAEPEQCKGIISSLEGGYDLPSLGRCVVQHIKGMAKL